jgi:hypothetical protein
MATVEYPGNVLPQPGYTKGNYSTDDELLASTAGFTQKGVTLAPGIGILPMGTVLGRNSTTKLWEVYASGKSNGAQVPRGVLRNSTDTGTDTTVPGFQANIVIQGILKNSKLSGADSNAVTVLNARQDTVLDLFTF